MWDLISFAKGRLRRQCLEALSSGPRMPEGIAKSTGEHLSHVSRALRELTERGLTECLTPTARKNRIYRLTKKGNEVLKGLQDMEG